MDFPKAVIKYGGHAMEVPELTSAFEKDVRELYEDSWSFILVHGGGPQIDGLLQRLHIQSEFVDGLRVTDDAAMRVVEMALCGTVNKSVVRDLEKNGLKVAGISGQDGKLLVARQISAALGRVGKVKIVNIAILRALLDGGFIPVVAPVGLDEEGNAININADSAAGAIAGALQADYFVLISNVPGVAGEDGKLIKEIDRNEIMGLRKSNVIRAGMIPKVDACIHALELGCKRALILDGTKPGSLKRFLLHNEPLGTMICL